MSESFSFEKVPRVMYVKLFPKSTLFSSLCLLSFSSSSPSFDSWMWTKFMGLPLAEVHWNAKDFASKDAKGQQQQQYVFASHPHGVASLHHIGLMMCPATCQDGRSFSDLSPIATRRDLGASVRSLACHSRSHAIYS